MSLIDENHTGTWGDVGLILEVPETNILATSNTDIGSLNSDADLLKEQFRASSVLSGPQLLDQTHATWYNEVVALANNDGNQVKLKGFFVKTTSKGDPVDAFLAKKIEKHATRLGLPVVKVQNINLDPDFEIYRTGDNLENLSVIRNGEYFYLVDSDPVKEFRVYEKEIDRTHFMSPQEREEIFEAMIAQGFNDLEDLDRIRKAHIAADDKRQRATVKFNEDGTVSVIKKREGYGLNETEYTITSDGYARSENVRAATNAMSQVLAGNRLTSSFSARNNVYKPLDRSRVQEIIDEAIEFLDDKDRETVTQWAQSILPIVKGKSQQMYGRSRDISDFNFG